MKRGRPRLQLDIDRIRQLREERWSLREIAKELGAGKDSIRGALRNPVGKMSKNSQEAKSSKKRPRVFPPAVVDSRASQGPKSPSDLLGNGDRNLIPDLNLHIEGRKLEIRAGTVNHADREFLARLTDRAYGAWLDRRKFNHSPPVGKQD